LVAESLPVEVVLIALLRVELLTFVFRHGTVEVVPLDDRRTVEQFGHRGG
jgi:hypothetical protein